MLLSTLSPLGSATLSLVKGMAVLIVVKARKQCSAQKDLCVLCNLTLVDNKNSPNTPPTLCR